MADIRHHARIDGDGYSSHMTWHDDVPPFDSEEKAKEFINNKDNGWYDDHAVRFLDYSGAKPTRKIEELRDKNVQLENEGEPQEPFYSDCPLPTVDTDQICKQSEWISVDERLPDDSTPCLVYTDNGDIFDSFYNNGFVAKFVTHWMKRPEPPRSCCYTEDRE